MKKLLLLIVIGAVFLHWRARQAEPQSEPESFSAQADESEAPPESARALPAVERETSRFHCDGRVYCSQMTSCEEAMYFLQNCPGVKMDNHGKGDGIPCERQWCRRQ